MVDQTSSVKSESLIFSDIMEEISTTVRKELSEFLQVQPYRLFREELDNFFKRINDLVQEEQKNGSNISRMTNHSQLVQTTSLKNDKTTIPNQNNGKIGEKYLLQKGFIRLAKNRIILIGNLLKSDQKTIKEKDHNAGFVRYRKEKGVFKTTKGLYRVVN